MTEYLKLLVGGKIALYKFDTEKNVQHRCKRKDGKRLIYNQQKELIKECNTQQEYNDFFYTEAPLKHIFTYLRSSFQVEEGATLGDLFSAIEANEDLLGLVNILFPMYPDIPSHPVYDLEEHADDLIVRHSGVVENGVFDVVSDIGFTNSQNWDNHTLLSVDENFSIAENENEIATMLFHPSLLEFLKALFVPNAEPVAFMKDGLYTSLGLKIQEPMEHLFSPCVIDDDLTLGDIFKYVEQHELLHDVIAMYSWCHGIEEFHRIAKLPAIDDGEPLWHLEISRSVKHYPGKESWFNNQPDFFGIGDLSEDMKSHYDQHPELKRPNHQTFSIGMSPMNTLAHLPVKFDDVMDFTIVGKNYEIKETKKFKTFFTLLDLLDAIYFEISFYGNPQEIQDLKEELQERIETIRDSLDAEGA